MNAQVMSTAPARSTPLSSARDRRLRLAIHALFDWNWQEHTKYRVDPGFYNAESAAHQLDKYNR